MSAGNASAAVGLANTNKQLRIGAYVQDTGLNLAGNALSGPGPSADGNYIGCTGSDIGANALNSGAYWDYNFLGEDVNPAFTVPANSGAAAGKTARWVKTSAGSTMTVAADGKCSVTPTGIVSATPTTGLYKTFLAAGTVVPVNAFLWVFLI